MTYQLISLLSAITASCVVMILHELPKSMAYAMINRKQYSIKKHIFKVSQYIDPVGLIFSVTCYAGFSRPYMYRIKDKRTNFILGIIGFVSLLLSFITSMVILKVYFISDISIIYQADNYLNYLKLFEFELIIHIAWCSMSMIIVNLFPVSTFDISLIIASKSPSKYFSIIQDDHIIKIALVLGMVFGIISSISKYILQFFM